MVEKKLTPATLKERRGGYERIEGCTFMVSYHTTINVPCIAKTPDGKTIGQKDTVLKALSSLKLPAATTLRALADSCSITEYQAYKAMRTLRLESKVNYVALPGKPPVYVIERIAEYPANICRFTGGVCDVNSCLFLKLCQNGNAKIKEGENA